MRSIHLSLVFAGCAVAIGVLAQLATTPMHANPAFPAESANTTGQNTSESRRPVLLELFTSEGCSSCPPADRLLEKFDRAQPVAGADLIVLSEHVDYWNRLGWTDPFSSAQFSERQQDYVSALHLEGPYTPQLLIDGQAEVVGSDERAARGAIQKAAMRAKTAMELDAQRNLAELKIAVHVSGAERGAALSLALASDREQSQVNRGENSGRMLRHVAVVRTLEVLGKVDAHGAFAKDVTMRLKDGEKGAWRVVAFLQDSHSRRVLGVAQSRL